jgi:D-alanyl-D-alanine carboxypeptidase/D-alanyl-D-alanine-endopeptidase (penicillin-binding protein 4)
VIGFLLALASLLVGACATKPTATGLPSDAQAIINSPEYAHGSWSWDAVELNNGKTLYASNENKLNFLGSTTKLFTVGTC